MSLIDLSLPQNVWPEGPIDFVSHGGPGSGPYLMLSALAQGFLEAGSPVEPSLVVLPDHDGADAIRRVAGSGTASVVGSCTPTYLTTPILHDMPETWDTLTPVAALVADSYVIAVAASNPVASAAELFSAPSTAGAPKLGGNTDIQAMLLRYAVQADVGVTIIHDQSDIMAALADGSIDWTSGVYSDFERYITAGSARLLATFDDDASPQQLAPTLVGQGIAVTFPLWRGLMASGDTTPEQLDVWDASLRVAMEQPAWSDYLTAQRQHSSYLDAARFAALLADENSRYSAWVKELPS